MYKLLVCLFLGSTLAFAQESLPLEGYKKLSIEAGFGANKAFLPFTPGYGANKLNFFNLNGSLRYMFNNQFGLKGSLGLDKIGASSTSQDFTSFYFRSSLEGVLNLGRALNFEEFTSNFSILLHAGGGISALSADKFSPMSGSDKMINLMFGITPEVKLNNSWAVMADVSMIGNLGQSRAFDFKSNMGRAGIDSYIGNVSVGLTYYIGKKEKHADWYVARNRWEDTIPILENRIYELEKQLRDSDNDGVADHLDQEPNTPAGATVNTKGQQVKAAKSETSQEDIEKAVDKYLEKKKLTSKTPVKETSSVNTDGPMMGLFYTVQIGYYHVDIPSATVRKISPLHVQRNPNGHTRYYTGVFNSTKEAQPTLRSVRNKGIKDAYITAMYQGEVISIQEAGRLLKENGDSILENNK